MNLSTGRTPRGLGRIVSARRLSVAAVALGAVLSVASPVAAATGAYGTHYPAQATCDIGARRFVVHLPNVAAAPATTSSGTFTVGGSFGGGTNQQWIGVRAWLIRSTDAGRTWSYTDQNRDGYFDRLPLLQVQTTSDGILWGANWYNADAKRWIAAGDTTFNIRDGGWYRVNVEYFWYTNGTVTGYDLIWSYDHYVTLWTTVNQVACAY